MGNVKRNKAEDSKQKEADKKAQDDIKVKQDEEVIEETRRDVQAAADHEIA